MRGPSGERAARLKAFLFTVYRALLAERPLPPREELVQFGTVPVAILLLSDVSLTTHHLTLMLALAALLGRYAMGREQRHRLGRWIWLAPGFLVAMTATGSGATKALSPMLFLTLLFAVGLVMLALRDRRAALGRGGEP